MPGQVEFNHNRSTQQEIIAQLEAGGVVTYTTDYAHHVEFDSFWGASPPPFEPLRAWVHRKWPDLDGGLKDAGLSPGIKPGSERHKDGVTWVVINSIKSTGIAGVFYGRRSLDYGRSRASAVAGKYEGTDDPRASFKIVEDILDLMFARSQEIVAEEASDTGNLLQSGLVELANQIDELPTVDS